MTEQQWLASENPNALMGFVAGVQHVGSPPRRLAGAGRRLRLFACAVTRRLLGAPDAATGRVVAAAEQHADGLLTEARLDVLRREALRREAAPKGRGVLPAVLLYDPTRAACEAIGRAVNPRDGDGVCPPREAADLLRDVFGNPFRPVALPGPRTCDWCRFVGDLRGTQHVETGEPCHVCGGGMVLPPLWGVPADAVSLAQAAYDERARPCPRCKGSGGFVGVGRCHDCQGSGTLDDGTLDPVRLAVLADALEEAGCPDRVECGDCLEGDVGCSVCEGAGCCYEPPYSLNRFACPHCDEGMLPDKCRRCDGAGRANYPLLEHLRSPGPHVRGCWALDLVLGR